MSNVTIGNTWVLDTVGVIKNDPVLIQRVVFRPTAASQVCKFTWYDLTNSVSGGCRDNTSATVSTGETLTGAAGTLPNTILAGSVFELIHESTGASVNLSKAGAGQEKKRYRVATAGSGTAVVVESNVWTNEGPFYYSWRNYPVYQAIYLPAGVSDASAVSIDFGDEGRWFPNLVLDTLTAGAADVYIK